MAVSKVGFGRSPGASLLQLRCDQVVCQRLLRTAPSAGFEAISSMLLDADEGQEFEACGSGCCIVQACRALAGS